MNDREKEKYFYRATKLAVIRVNNLLVLTTIFPYLSFKGIVYFLLFR